MEVKVQPVLGVSLVSIWTTLTTPTIWHNNNKVEVQFGLHPPWHNKNKVEEPPVGLDLMTCYCMWAADRDVHP